MGGTAEWYDTYYRARGADRNDPLSNPGVLMQLAAHDLALARSIRRAGVGPDARVLDVGCGAGLTLSVLARLGIPTPQLTGVDIIARRIEEGLRRFPFLDLRHADAASLDIPSGSFDVVMESTMFAQLTDPAEAAAVAGEMRRVCKPQGIVLLADWRIKRPFQTTEGSLPRSRVRRLFPDMEIVGREQAALVPPIGRFLSARAPTAYFPVQRLLPFLVGMVVYTLRSSADR